VHTVNSKRHCKVGRRAETLVLMKTDRSPYCGKPEKVDAAIGLYFTDQAPRRQPMLLQLENDGAIDIPPGSATASVTDHLVLPIDVDLLAVYPHTHYLGKRVEAWAELPGGARTPLLRIEDWDMN
jgi:hypothetical protein